MSKLWISQYYRELDAIVQRGASYNENSIRYAFQSLLNNYLKPKNFSVVSELYSSRLNKPIQLDGIIKDDLGLDWGYWEAKDPKDNLEKEIENKFAIGYPNDNILFENSVTAILIQKGQETMRVSMKQPEELDSILNAFINYVRPAVKQFREAIELFKQDLPTILNTLRDLINQQGKENQKFIDVRHKFLTICQESINPNIGLDDIQEMIIQHILTEDILLNIFNEVQFHWENKIVRQLQEVINTFLTGITKRNLLSSIERYYSVIRSRAGNIVDHHQKQEFLKIVYESFYKAYNPLAADRLGIVYTPNEIVKFMIESTDYLLHKHFNKLLENQDVEILDPATGTGTFITELIEYLPKNRLQYKYEQEIHCNEVAILPYYIANLNIEFTYQQKMGEYLKFNNICFVDTLDHTSFHLKQTDLFAISQENTERIKPQNDHQILVIIGNPPYNARQEKFNYDNANRSYQSIDNRIKETYIKQGKAQNQITLYDMYVRFIRWASDRLNENGIVAFVTNSSFIDALTFDGFRKVLGEEFSHIYLLDLGGNMRAGDKTGNVFNIMVGIAITFLIRKREKSLIPCQIYYYRVSENTRKNKLDFLTQNKLNNIDFTHITPDRNYNWINQSNNDFDDLLPLIDKEVKGGKSEEAIFKLFSRGLLTQRDKWVYDFSKDNLIKKIEFLIHIYQKTLKSNDCSDKNKIKWDAELTSYVKRKIEKEFNDEQIVISLYRPFTKQYLYFDKHFNGRTYQWFALYNKDNHENKYITFVLGKRMGFATIASTDIIDLGLFVTDQIQCLSLYSYDKDGNKIENITDWGLKQFRDYYNNITPPVKKGKSDKNKTSLSNDNWEDKITKEDIFYYVYAVLHNPEYRKKYELNLKRDFPRIPFYDNFDQWVNWGKQLMELHLDYETITPYKLTRINTPLKNSETTPKPKLKADKTKGEIILDDVTILTGIPKIVWEYQLGNRSALEWILDQYKEKKPKDQTIAERFNTYRFTDYKETVIDLLKRVTTVSVKTMNIIHEMSL